MMDEDGDEIIPNSELSELHIELISILQSTPRGSHPLEGLAFSSEGYPLFKLKKGIGCKVYLLTNKHPMDSCSCCQAGICIQRVSPGDPVIVHFSRLSLS